jgi:hypothetical protein
MLSRLKVKSLIIKCQFKCFLLFFFLDKNWFKKLYCATRCDSNTINLFVHIGDSVYFSIKRFHIDWTEVHLKRTHELTIWTANVIDPAVLTPLLKRSSKYCKEINDIIFKYLKKNNNSRNLIPLTHPTEFQWSHTIIVSLA